MSTPPRSPGQPSRRSGPSSSVILLDQEDVAWLAQAGVEDVVGTDCCSRAEELLSAAYLSAGATAKRSTLLTQANLQRRRHKAAAELSASRVTAAAKP